MKICLNCKLEYEDKYAFCHQCGSKLQEKIEQNFCPFCGNKIETDGGFCPFCGNSLEKTESVVNTSNAIIDNSLKTTNKSYSSESVVKSVSLENKQSVYEIKESDEPFFSKQHLLTYNGRRGRLSYLKVGVFWSIIIQILTLFLVPIVIALGNVVGLLFAFLIDLVLAYPMFCNVSKRMHDLDWPTSWSAVLCLFGVFLSYGNEVTKSLAGSNNSMLYGKVVVALIFCIPFIILTFKKGTEGPNQYGEDPV